MEKKEAYQPTLPSNPGQAWMVTLCLWDAVPPGALANYTDRLKELRWKIDYRKRQQLYDRRLKELENDYLQTRRHYFNAYDRLLSRQTGQVLNLSQPDITAIIQEGLTFWAASLLENYAWCMMPNHVHWVFRTRDRDNDGNPVALSVILEEVKQQTGQQINQLLKREGPLWQKESFEMPLRNNRQLNRAIDFTLNNPVAARLVDDRSQWPGSWRRGGL